MNQKNQAINKKLVGLPFFIQTLNFKSKLAIDKPENCFIFTPLAKIQIFYFILKN
jgi:hypothetical protein